MNRKERDRRIIEALRDVYNEAESAFPRKFSFDEIEEVMKSIDLPQREKRFPWWAFSLSDKRQKEIIKKYTKYTRWSWRWPRKSQIGKDGKLIPDPEWDKHSEDYSEMALKLDRKEITLKEFNAWMKEEAKKYGMIPRNYDAEAISFNVYNYGPNTADAKFFSYKKFFESAWEKWSRDNTVTEFITSDDIPEVTDEDVESAIEKNQSCINHVRKVMGDKHQIDGELVDKYTDPAKVRSDLESGRTRSINQINNGLLDMIVFWNAWLRMNRENC